MTAVEPLDIETSISRTSEACGCDIVAILYQIAGILWLQSFANIKSYIDMAKNSPDVTILAGGDCDER